MEDLKYLNNIRQSLERQLENCRYEDQGLIEELEEVEYKIKYLEELETLPFYEEEED